MAFMAFSTDVMDRSWIYVSSIAMIWVSGWCPEVCIYIYIGHE